MKILQLQSLLLRTTRLMLSNFIWLAFFLSIFLSLGKPVGARKETVNGKPTRIEKPVVRIESVVAATAAPIQHGRINYIVLYMPTYSMNRSMPRLFSYTCTVRREREALLVYSQKNNAIIYKWLLIMSINSKHVSLKVGVRIRQHAFRMIHPD